jgi:hypothetical protein
MTGTTGATGPPGMQGIQGIPGTYNGLLEFTKGPQIVLTSPEINDYVLTDAFTYFNLISFVEYSSVLNGFERYSEGRFVIIVNNTPYEQYFREEVQTSQKDHRFYFAIGTGNGLILYPNQGIILMYATRINVYNDVTEETEYDQGRWINLSHGLYVITSADLDQIINDNKII